MAEIHLTDRHETIQKLQFDRPFHLVSQAAHNAYAIYALRYSRCSRAKHC